MTDRDKALLDLFIHPGWQILMDEMREAHQVMVETAWTVRDERELFFRKGQIQKLAELINAEAASKAMMDAQEDADAE